MSAVEKLLVFAMATLHFAVMSGSIGTNKFVMNMQSGSSNFKQRMNIAFAIRKAIGEFKTIVCLYTLHVDSSPLIPEGKLLEKISRGISGLLFIGSEETEPGEFVNGGILEQAKFGICYATTGNHLYINLDSLPRIPHLLVRFRRVFLLRLGAGKHPFPAHNSKQTFRAARISSFS